MCSSFDVPSLNGLGFMEMNGSLRGQNPCHGYRAIDREIATINQICIPDDFVFATNSNDMGKIEHHEGRHWNEIVTLSSHDCIYKQLKLKGLKRFEDTQLDPEPVAALPPIVSETALHAEGRKEGLEVDEIKVDASHISKTGDAAARFRHISSQDSGISCDGAEGVDETSGGNCSWDILLTPEGTTKVEVTLDKPVCKQSITAGILKKYASLVGSARQLP